MAESSARKREYGVKRKKSQVLRAFALLNFTMFFLGARF
jgi:hypothetical protein